MLLLAPMFVAAMAAAPGATVFVNFDGAELTTTEDFAEDDARSNTSWLFGGEFVSYGDGVKRAAVLQALRADWAEFDIAITDIRPTSGDYTMSVVTPTNPAGGNIVGYAPVDCWDESSQSNITFAFHSAGDKYSATEQATTISQELAHSFGLEHVDEPSDIMNPTKASGDPRFTAACQPVIGHSYCGEQHVEFCAIGQQNAHAELLAMLGPTQGSAVVPGPSIVQPADGERFAEGDTVVIELGVGAETSVGTLVLMHNGETVGPPSNNQPFRWTLSNLEFGVHELYVVSADSAGNETETATILIGAGVDPQLVLALGTRGDRGEALSCSTSGATPTPAWALLILVAAFRRSAFARRPVL